MKKYLKSIIPSTIFAFVSSFMLYIYEPIITYSSNMNDFWFDYKLMLPNIIIYFLALFLLLLVFFNIIYWFCRLIKKEVIYKVIVIISFVFLIFAYIQGIFLVGNLPTLDGTTIEWSSYKKEMAISLIVFLVIITTEIFGIIKFKTDKTLNVNAILGCVILVMLSTSFVSVLLKPDLYKEKIIAVSTDKNINNISSNKNFLIFLADAVDSIEFSSVVDDDSIFEDFTYYPDTVSAYTFTRDAIPFIFSGIWNKNETEFSEYSTNAFNESKILNALNDKQYSLNMFEDELIWHSRKAEEIANVEIYNDKIPKIRFFKQLTKFILYKYLPFPLKKYSKINTVDFESCKIEKEDDEGVNYYTWGNTYFYDLINNNPLEKSEQNYFQFIHIEGAHVPFDTDENLNPIPEEEGTYDLKLKATAKIIDTYIKRLKANDAYDNSVIIVMADHGYWAHNNGRQNPILYIKGINEHHEMYTSDIPVSYEDLNDAFIELLEESKSQELFQNIDKNRVRKFIYNAFKGEDTMEEYEQRGKAWDKNATVETGVKFIR